MNNSEYQLEQEETNKDTYFFIKGFDRLNNQVIFQEKKLFDETISKNRKVEEQNLIDSEGKKWVIGCGKRVKEMYISFGKKESIVIRKEDKEEDITVKNINEALEKILPEFEGPVLIESGHFMPNLEDFSKIGTQPLNALKKALFFLEKLITKYNKKTDLILFINDLHMTFNHGSENRKKYFENFSMPTKMSELIKEYKDKLEFNVFVTAERQLYNRFVKDSKKEKWQEKKLVMKDMNGSISIHLDDGTYKIIEHGENLKKISSKCYGACAKLCSLSKNLGYRTLLSFYPICGKHGSEIGTKVARKVYGEDLLVVNAYTTFSCFS